MAPNKVEHRPSLEALWNRRKSASERVCAAMVLAQTIWNDDELKLRRLIPNVCHFHSVHSNRLQSVETSLLPNALCPRKPAASSNTLGGKSP